MRQDIHRPSEIIPEDYHFVAFEHLKVEGFGDCAFVLYQRELIRAHMAATGGTYSHHEHGGNCMVCGAWAVYTVLFYHAKTNTYVRTGQDCANKMEMSYGDMNAFRRQVYDHRLAKAGVRKAEAFMADHDLLRVLEIVQEHAKARLDQEQEYDGRRRWQDARVIEDIFTKLVKYGSISDAQVGLLRIKVQRHDGYEARQRQFAVEREAAQPCPTGRIKVTGSILKLAEYDSQFGTTLKMTVKATEGFLVFVSVPSALANTVARGQEVSFVATLTPSDRDPKFGFGKRPVAV